MEMKDVLPASGPVRLAQVESFRRQPLVKELRDLLGHHHHCGQIALRDVPDVRSVRAGHHQRVTRRRLAAIEEGHAQLILGHNVSRCLACNNAAENTVSHPTTVWHDSRASPPLDVLTFLARRQPGVFRRAGRSLPVRRSGGAAQRSSVCQVSDSRRAAEELVTSRLSLRRPAPADVDAIFSINSDRRACAHNPSDLLASRDEAHELFRRWDEHWSRLGFGYWVVRRRDSAAPIGFCGIKGMQLDGTDVLNLFYRFDPAVWGSGLASEAASAVTGWVAQNLADRTLIARIRPQNVASQRVAVRAGLARAEQMDTIGEDGVDWIFIPATDLRGPGAL
jgi:[ribosomal protein S5]-alanine N-acetyltransferase